MKKLLFIFVLVFLTFSFESYAQIVADTFISTTPYSMPGNCSGNVPISTCLFHYNFSVYKQSELLAKGIVPGDTIYGIAYYKANNVTLSSSANVELYIRHKTNYDSTITIPANGLFSPVYLYFTYLPAGYSITSPYLSGGNLTLPSTVGWIPFMLDAPFIYSGGNLDIMSECHSSTNSYLGTLSFSIYTVSGSNSITFSHNPNSTNSFPFNILGGISGGSKPAIIIFHSTNPPACNGIPVGGSVNGPLNICANRDFSLYLFNPSAGPGINYQWQKAPISSSSWLNVTGATLPSANFNINSPTKFRCKVTCGNSSQFAYSTEFPIYPFQVHIDSVAHSVSGNVITVQCYHNDTSTTSNGVSYNFGDSVGVIYYPLIGNPQVQKTYTHDGTYTVTAYIQSDCSADTFYFPITIGCAGSTTFNNTISSMKDTTCPGSPATLIINDTLPSNYTFSGTGSLGPV